LQIKKLIMNSTIIRKKKKLKCGCFDYAFSNGRCKTHATIEDTAKRVIKYRNQELNENKEELWEWFKERRKEMKGEGAIQVQEGQLAERAISGDINFTPTELKILANAAKRSAEYTQKQYERKLQHMAGDKETAGLVPYFAVPAMSPMNTTTGNVNNGGWSVKSVK